MQVKFYKNDKCLIAKMIGELDHHSASKVREKIDFEIVSSSCKTLILDFSEVAFMDSSGIGVVVGRYKNVTKMNGNIFVSNVSEKIRRIFEMCGVFKLVPELEKSDENILLAGGTI